MQNKRIEIINEGKKKAFSDDGVDLTLIRWMLSLTPDERLDVLQANIKNITKLRNEIKRK